MIRDVFYYGKKPNIHPREKFASSFDDAKKQNTTEHFWIINEFCDYTKFDWDFDFEFLPDIEVWHKDHINIWPSTHQKDSGTWLCSENCEDIKIYRTDVDPIKRKNIISENWVFKDNVDKTKFDFSWHPDPTDPPYIYKWGCKFYPAEMQPCLEYHTPNATEIKYMSTIVELVPNYDLIKEIQKVDTNKFDLSWRPDPREPPFIYVWGNKYISGELQSTLEYHCICATQRKYMGNVAVLPEWNKWKILIPVDETSFDFSWRPDPREPPFIYVWGNKYNNAETEPTVEYHCPGAIQRKYMNDRVANTLPDKDKWKILIPIDEASFDFSWRPNPHSPPYIYVWGNKYNNAETEPTVEYRCKNATEIKYMNDRVANTLPDKDKWKILIPIDEASFDFNWRPNPHSPPYIYVWGNKYNNAETEPTLEYHCPNATEIKYMNDSVANTLPNKDKWKILIPVDESSFDFTWRPDPHSPPYIYVWGNKYNDAVTEPTIEYRCPDATEIKYINDIVVSTLPDKTKWKILIPIDESSFDFSWRPNPHSPPYIYVWGNKYNDATTEPTIEYHCKNATQKQYMTDKVAHTLPDKDKWKMLIPIDEASFDFSWRPNPHSLPYIYVWGNKYNSAEKEPTIEYHSPESTERKYINDVVANTLPDKDKWKILIPVDETSFDFTWRPDPHSPPYIYVFGNKWNDAATEPTIEYHVKGATEYKYVDYPLALTKPDMQYWQVSNKEDLETFDFSWRPNPHSPPQIYQWINNGPQYTVPGATEVVLMEYKDANKKKSVNRYYIITTLEDLINEHLDEVFWALNSNLNYEKFDFNWSPTKDNFTHINVFGNQFSKNTQTYYINGPMYKMGYRQLNYVEDQTIEIDSSNLDIFFIDKSNGNSQERFDYLKKKFPQLQKTRYLNSWVDTINRCATKASTKFFWVLSSELDYTDFIFDFYPSPWQEKMVHVFGTQWSHWGNTYFINKESFPNDTKYVKIIEHLNVLNFVKSRKAKAVDILYDIVHIDHGNITEQELDEIQNQGRLVIKYEKNYLDTFKKMLEKLSPRKEHYVWVISTICDYSDFDFTYICDPFAKEQLHVFPSNNQKFGDTFLVNINKLRELINDMTILEDYNKVNFNQHQRTNRLSPPIFVTSDTHTSDLRDDYDFPYAVYVTNDNEHLKNINDREPLSLWNDNKDILITSTGRTRIIVPKETKSYIKTELYDYPHIKTSDKLLNSNPLDIIFFSNGEVGSDENYEHLLNLTKNKNNRVIRIDKIQGRVKSQHAAAHSSNTPWYFLVNAKLKVNKDFDFDWQPDRLQIPKHYIFLATNPVNGLEYGHQAIVANNRTLTLNTVVKGLDFTMDSEHEVVNINSGIGIYNTSPWDTWRTAFREVIKLRYSDTEENKQRLDIWLTKAEGDFSEYSIFGAKDAIEFYDSVNGDLEKLKLTYDWPFLHSEFLKKYK